MTSGDSLSFYDETRELCAVVLTGTVSAKTDGLAWNEIGGRKNVFEDAAPYAIYVPPRTRLTTTATTLTVVDGSIFPAANFEVVIDGEVIQVASRAGNTLNGLTRAMAGTAAAAHALGATVTLGLTVAGQGGQTIYKYDPGLSAPANSRPVQPGDQLLDQDIKRAVDEQLAGKGLRRVESGGDLVVGYQAGISQEKELNSIGTGGWGPWGGGFNSFSASTSTINIGTFVLGMYDPAVKKLVWIGAAQHALEPSKKQEKNQERLNKGAQKLLKDFPPGRK